MKPENFNLLENLSNQITEKTIDIQQEISKPSSYVAPNYQRLMKEAIALQKEWKRMIIINFVCAASALVVGLCIWQLMGELGIFVAVPLTIPVTIHFGWQGLRLLLQGDPIRAYRQRR